MRNINKQINFLNYIKAPMSKESIAILYSANNIKFERCELYSDFVQSLMLLIFDTYLGDDITNNKEQINHFNWCWYKNLDNFKNEGIIVSNSYLYNYFLDFMLEVYYIIPNKNKNPNLHIKIINLWVLIFKYNNSKSKSDMDTLLEIYKIFDKSLKKH